MNPKRTSYNGINRRAPRSHQRRVLLDRRKAFRFELDSERRRSGEPRRVTDTESGN
ncbi:MAG: hypothetical protein KAS48_03180 [Gammaproteobacteria bacterium]|nr:hypothetical protein [Gammaproteobacteria bacterium]